MTLDDIRKLRTLQTRNIDYNNTMICYCDER